MNYNIHQIKALMKMAFKAGKKRGEEEVSNSFYIEGNPLSKRELKEINFENPSFEEWFEKTFPSKSVIRRIKHQSTKEEANE